MKTKIRESELLRDILRHPKKHVEALLYMGLSATCLTASVLLFLVR